MENYLPNITLYTFILFLIAVMLSMVINGLFVKFSHNMGMRSGKETDIVRWASTSKPAFGGISFFILFLFSFAIFALVPNGSAVINQKYLSILLASTVGFLIGLADDSYNTKPLLKFSGQLLCSIILLSAGIVIEISPYRLFNYVFSIFWIIGIMNSINMLDNMDGIVSSISLVIILTILFIINLQHNNEPFFYITGLGVVASLVGFLFYNWHPSKIYMGDTGSQFLGVFLAAMSILFIWNIRDVDGPFIQLKQFVIPMLIFIIPLIDTATVSIRRMARGQSPFVGGRDHITHHLALLGLPDGLVTAVYLFITICSCILGAVLLQSSFKSHIFTSIGLGVFISLFIIVQIMYQKNAHDQQKVNPNNDI